MTLVRPEAWTPRGVDDLEPRAWEALRETDRSVCVTAGAGAGKTEFLAQKATYLLQTGLSPAPKRILAISFKRDAARNLAERVAKRSPPEQALRFDSLTFDAFTKHLVNQFRAALPGDFRPPLHYRIVLTRRADFSEFLERYGFRGVAPDVFERRVERTALPDEGTLDAFESRAVRRYWQSQYGDYDEVLLSFPMINRLAEWIIRQNPAIRRALQLTYPTVFLDEFQDTTYAQFELVRTAFEGSGALFTAVGDDKQRIMGWAGAMSDAFDEFERCFAARRVALLSNWRAHPELVRVQHVIASQIDPGAELPEARGRLDVDGDVAAVWQFGTRREECETLAHWIAHEVETRSLAPHDFAILVRARADDVEAELVPALEGIGLKLRNVARAVGEIAIQDLLGEDLTAFLVPLLRLGATARHPESWTRTQQNLQFLEALAEDDDLGQERLQRRLQAFIRDLRVSIGRTDPDEASVQDMASRVLEFVDAGRLRQAFPAYQRTHDWNRVWEGFVGLLQECALPGGGWPAVLDRFEGLGQVPLMTVHKSKGLEFHTMIFYGLDNRTWWSLTPAKAEELNAFFVAFTRARQRAFFTVCNERGEPITWIEDLLSPAGVHRVDGISLLGPPL